MEIKEIKVGQEVWVKPSEHYRGKIEVYKALVVKVGTKYFQINDGYRNDRYCLKTLIQENDTNYKNKVYLSLQKIEDEVEHQKLSDSIKKSFSYFGKSPFSLDALRKIHEILNPPTVK